MRLPRLTTRRLMVIVAVVALCAWGRNLVRRSNDASFSAMINDDIAIRRAEIAKGYIRLMHETESRVIDLEKQLGESEKLDAADWPESPIPRARVPRALLAGERRYLELLKSTVSKLTALRQYYERLAAKYRRVARYPWLPVPPDPPEPE
jgi:hypothetical protein